MRLSVKRLKQNIILEFRTELFQQLRAKYANLPEYVLSDLFRGADEKFFGQLNRLNWRLEVLDVKPSDFSPDTQQKLSARRYGDANPGNVPDDERRTQFQRDLASRTQTGENEPIIVVKGVDGYRLWEGWHRVMSILRKGSNAGPPEGWDRVKIRAWVGSRA